MTVKTRAAVRALCAGAKLLTDIAAVLSDPGTRTGAADRLRALTADKGSDAFRYALGTLSAGEVISEAERAAIEEELA